MWVLVLVAGGLVFAGWLADVNQTIVSARQPLISEAQQQTEDVTGKTAKEDESVNPPVSFTAALKDAYTDFKQLFQGTSKSIEVNESQSEEGQADKNKQNQEKQKVKDQPVVEPEKKDPSTPGSLPFE